MPLRRYSSLIPLLAILGSVTCLGLGTSWAKHSLFPLVGAQGTTAVRVGFSALLLLLFWRPWRWQLSRADLRTVALYGAALGLTNLCFYMALRTIPFGIAVAIEFSGPLAVALLASRRPLDFVWVALAVAGLALLLPLGHDVSNLDPTGVLFALGAAVCWASYIVFGKRASHLHAGHSVSLGLAMAALVVVPVGVMHSGAALLSPVVLGVGLGVALISSDTDLAGNGGPEAADAASVRHHEQHGTGRGRHARLHPARRAPGGRAMAGDCHDHGRVDGQFVHGAAPETRCAGAQARI